MTATKRPLVDGPIAKRAIGDAFVKLNPRHMLRNPVMFVVLIGSVLTTLVLVRDIAEGRGDIGFTVQIALWLWFTVVFANFVEAMAEGRGKGAIPTDSAFTRTTIVPADSVARYQRTTQRFHHHERHLYTWNRGRIRTSRVARANSAG